MPLPRIHDASTLASAAVYTGTQLYTLLFVHIESHFASCVPSELSAAGTLMTRTHASVPVHMKVVSLMDHEGAQTAWKDLTMLLQVRLLPVGHLFYVVDYFLLWMQASKLTPCRLFQLQVFQNLCTLPCTTVPIYAKPWYSAISCPLTRGNKALLSCAQMLAWLGSKLVVERMFACCR
jgi:hypothetical protein